MRKCQAVTLAGTYSAAHPCLKRGAKKAGKLFLCTHHRAMAARRAK